MIIQQPNQSISELQPFNEFRFVDCMSYLSLKYGCGLTQNDVVKLHLMTDVWHVLRWGKPVIGGPIEAWQWGPVIRPGYVLLMTWVSAYLQCGQVIEGFCVRERLRGNVHSFSATSAPSADEFSSSELAAMDMAWQTVMSLNFKARERYFHGDSFIGRAWQNATARGIKTPIDWLEIIGNYERDANLDLSHIKTIITL